MGMPGGISRYRLLVRLEPYDSIYNPYFATDSAGPYNFSFDIPDGTTRVWLKVQAVGYGSNPLVSQSNIVNVERLTVDTAAFLSIRKVEYDSLNWRNVLTFDIDTDYHAGRYLLFRSIDGRPWDSIAAPRFSSPPFTYVDNKINVYDSLHCYMLAVFDACGLNPHYSNTKCVVVPTPPNPSWEFPNIIVAGDATNGTFLPRLRGLKGDLYELFVYNRNGLLVHSTTNPSDGWTPATDTPQGVYAYALRCRFNNNIVKILTGTIVVIK